MTHLPDCDDYAFSGAEYHPNCERICICRQVRRIEQRVLDAARAAIAGLQVAIPSYYPDDSLLDVGFWRPSALAAIDALKEQP